MGQAGKVNVSQQHLSFHPVQAQGVRWGSRFHLGKGRSVCSAQVSTQLQSGDHPIQG